jgi:hypothetical protein
MNRIYRMEERDVVEGLAVRGDVYHLAHRVMFCNNGGDHGIVVIEIGVLVAEPLKPLGKWLWKKIKAAFQAAGFGFEKRYLRLRRYGRQCAGVNQQPIPALPLPGGGWPR